MNMYIQKVTSNFNPTPEEIDKQLQIAKEKTTFRKVKKFITKQNHFELILTK